MSTHSYTEEQPNGDIIMGRGRSTNGIGWKWERMRLIQGKGYQHFTRVPLDSMPSELQFDGEALHRALTE